ncbi:procathepsin L-like [Daphnia carinata]|uniref:procathepsin L-like n=1 Tax=Daphnia carinata TaxID=120202 RepID=UPI002579BDC4|nr:procathepsin L-like [Daphnia carinata]
MKFLLTYAVFAIAASLIYGQCDYDDEFNWRAYKKNFDKSYTGAEDAKRKVNFKKANDFIKKHNANSSVSFKVDHNELSDLTEDEFAQRLGLKGVPQARGDFAIFSAGEDRQIPPAGVRVSMNFYVTSEILIQMLDYRNDNCMPPIKNQGACGSCWAFAATTPLEFAKCKKDKTSIILSEQQLVDCDRSSSNNGCNGGFYSTAWKYYMAVGGVAKQFLYPYAGANNTCKFTTSMVAAKVSSYTNIQAKNVTAMQLAIQKNDPVPVAISVTSSFQFYSSGVYKDAACNNIGVNHAVAAVGWGVHNGINYWIIRNSWGPRWGQKGYILMQRGVNLCKVEDFAYYAITV